MVGVWSDDPALRERLHAYAEKAMREAGDRTTWTAPDADYESAVHAAVDAAFDDARVTRRARRGARRGHRRRAGATPSPPSWSGSPSRASPTSTRAPSCWEQSLVDPDNRRPVDFDGPRRPAGRRSGPTTPSSASCASRCGCAATGPSSSRRTTPSPATGDAADHVLAFDRGGAVTVATRLPVGLAERGGWGDTTLALPAGGWRDLLTGGVVTSDGSVAVADLLTELPGGAARGRCPSSRGPRGRFDVWAPLPERLRLVGRSTRSWR